MLVFRGRNVHGMLPVVLGELLRSGVRRDSRNGPVIMFPEPVTTVYEKPNERVLFHPLRDANPFFHLAESLWMLAGRNDVQFVASYVARMRDYSDNGETFHGAYGFRWRKHFALEHTTFNCSYGFRDQLTSIIQALRKNPDDRRQVLSMWDASTDLGKSDGKDLPCNTQALFQVTFNGELDMTVMNRSNDIIWGAYGANAVHFSMLHEFMARSIGVPQGRYRQVSANFHAYDNQLFRKVGSIPVGGSNPYDMDCDGAEVSPYPLMSVPQRDWEDDLMHYMAGEWSYNYQDKFFSTVAVPVAMAHAAHKAKNQQGALSAARDIAASDWRRACLEWLGRRY